MQIIQGKKYFEAAHFAQISDIVRQGALHYPEKEAILYCKTAQDPVTAISYQQFAEDMKALKEALLELGLGGTRIGVVGENSYEWLLAYMSVLDNVGVIVPLDRLLPAEELASSLQRGQVSALFLDGLTAEKAGEIVGSCPGVRVWVVGLLERLHRSENFAEFRRRAEAAGAQVFVFDELLNHGREILQAGSALQDYPLDPQALAVLLFTSGTTALSKAVMLSNSNILSDVRALMETVHFVDNMRSLSILPLHHTFENTCGFLTSLAFGATVAINTGLRYIAQNLVDFKPHLICGVPTLFDALYRRIISSARKQHKLGLIQFMRKLSRLLLAAGIDLRRRIFRPILDQLGGNLYIGIAGAAAMNPEVLQFFLDMDVHVLQGYGLTETSPVVAGCNTQFNVIGSIGQPLSGVTIAIDSETAGESGELLVKGDMVMIGYYDNAEGNAAAFDAEGWFHTGDVGYWDEKKQAIYLNGRSKSMIVLHNGKKVFPEELEALLLQDNLIRDAMVYGQDDGSGDPVLTAELVLDGEEAERRGIREDRGALRQQLAELISRVNGALPAYKGIRAYLFGFGDMVRTTTLKVRRSQEIARITDLLQRGGVRTWQESNGFDLDQASKAAEAAPRADAEKQG